MSALELARKAGWNENILDVETRVTTAIAALEEAGYIRRGQTIHVFLLIVSLRKQLRRLSIE